MSQVKTTISFFVLLAVFWSPTSHTAVEGRSGKVTSIMAHDTLYGNCMIYIASTSTIDCPGGWVSLSCSGQLNTRSNAARMLEMAQMAYATNTNVYVNVTDEKKHNGYCVVNRLDISK